MFMVFITQAKLVHYSFFTRTETTTHHFSSHVPSSFLVDNLANLCEASNVTQKHVWPSDSTWVVIEDKIYKFCMRRYGIIFSFCDSNGLYHKYLTSADLGGVLGARPPPHPTGPNSFVFTYIFGKKHPRRRSTPPYGKS